MIRRLLFFTAIGVALFCIGIWRLSDGFSLAKITDPLKFEARWEVDSPSSFQIRSILSQPFYYMGKGSQCYVFESADKQFVLKFFRFSRYRLPAFQEALPLPPFLAAIQNKRSAEKREKREKLFTSCKLAYEELREESGLVYLHLNKTTNLTQTVILYDNLKRPLTLQIDQYAFMIQKKGEQIYSYLGRLIKEQKIEEAERALMSLSALLDRRKRKGIADGDAEIHKNAGFRNGKALFFDVGQFRKEKDRDDRQRVVRKLLLWLEAKDAKLASDARVILELNVPACW